ncbi:GTP-binding protein [Sodaliphilus sp.]|uniref:GTP-binding protein n=1 Tax=Sodaliphilus sp. TaxID=2815818 RepID=UPI00388DAEDC
MAHVTPILLLTGYLGSGKTTLVNHILTNERNIKFAVIVNDIGEVNIDADLIQKGGIVGQKDESLVALQNGCICCTLKMDLVEQINDILKMDRFDYIVIEASGICEPEPIAQTICNIPTMAPEYTQHGIGRLDCIVTVVDALRMASEFDCGKSLVRNGIDDEDIENLLIQQIEFCNIILLNKVSEVEPAELARVKEIIRALQPKAQIIECDYANVDLDQIVNTGMFNYEGVATSAMWVQKIEGIVDEHEDDDDDHHHGHHHEHHHDHDDDDDDHHHHHHHDEDCDCEECQHEHDEEHEHGHHHHHHHHHHDGGEVEEYGIGTYVYYRRKPFNLEKFDRFVATKWPRNVIRAKGILYFSANNDMSYLFEQAGVQKTLREAGLWFATMPPEELYQLMQREPGIIRDWDEEIGDRMIKLVFIGQRLDKKQLAADLDACLE